jgi:hypothetical protein
LGEHENMAAFSDVALIIFDENDDEYVYSIAIEKYSRRRLSSNKDWKESADGERKVEIKEVDPDAMEAVLKFIYKGETTEKRGRMVSVHFRNFAYRRQILISTK